ncbi:MAG: PIN domain-containing protein [Janthinobacterium lividum]
MIPNRIVLDTNVCLDLFVFHDPRWATLLAALEAGTVEAITRSDCRDEWLIVLEYPHLPLDERSRAWAIAAFDRLIALAPAPAPGVAALLPRCSDKDDQKFLELARDGRAAILVTKDRALLKLARKTARAGMFAIIKPEAWAVASTMQGHGQTNG